MERADIEPSPAKAGAASPSLIAWLRGPAGSSPHATLVDALEAAAEADAELLTLHLKAEPEALPARLLRDRAARWASRLMEAGVERGEPVPLLLPTGSEFITAFFGVLWCGAVPVPLSSPMTFGGVDRYLANRARVVADSGAKRMVLTPRMAEAAATHAELSAQLEVMLLPGDADDSAMAKPAKVRPEDTGLLQYTSGTTGDPKGARISHAALVANAYAIQQGLELGPQDVGVSWLPMFHDMGLIGVLLTAVCHPYPLHLLRPEAFVMRPGRWLDLMSEVGATLTAGPNFAYALCLSRARTKDDLDLSSLRRALNGSEPVHASTVRAFHAHYAEAQLGAHVSLPVYGMAEATLAITFPDVGAPMRTLTLDRQALELRGEVRMHVEGERTEAVSVGRPVTGAEVRVRRADLELAQADQVGEIEVGGASLMDGYHGRAEATAEVLVEGWLRTGDLGFVHEGELYVVGRKKEVVIKGGRNIYPYDVERVACDLTQTSAAAFGRYNADAGTDDLVLVVETRSLEPEARAELEKQVRGDILATLGVKVDEVHLWPIGALPRTTSGKVRRGACAATLAEREAAEPIQSEPT